MESKINQIQKRIADPNYSARAAWKELQSELNCSGENWTKRLSENAATLTASLNRRARVLLQHQLWVGGISCMAVLGVAFLGTYLANRSVLRESVERQAMSATKSCVEQLLRQEEKLAKLEQQVTVAQSRLNKLRATVGTTETALNQLNEQIKLREISPLPQFRDPATGQRYQFTVWPPEVRQTPAGNTWAVAPIRPLD